MKTCCKCGEVKSLDDFHRNKPAKDGRFSYCKECACAARREWRAQNLERDRENQRLSRSTAQNRDKIRERNRRWHENNPEYRREYARQYYEQNQERLQEAQRQNYEQNKERYIATASRRRAVTETNLTQDDQDYIKILRQDPCAYCGETGGVIDHIGPLAKGGTVDWTNLTAACSKCNARKHTSSLLDFLARSPAL